MKLFKIALLSILSFSALGSTPMENISGTETPESTISPQISPQAYHMFLGAKLINLADITCTWTLAQQPLEKGGKLCILLVYIIPICSYIIHKIFANHITETLQPESPSSAKNPYKTLLRKGAFFLSHAYLLCGTGIFAYQSPIRDNKKDFSYYKFYVKSAFCLSFMHKTAIAALQYKTMQALENPKHYTVPAALKTTLSILTGLLMTTIPAWPTHKLSWWGMISTGLIRLFNLYATTNYMNKIVAAAEHHITTQQQK